MSSRNELQTLRDRSHEMLTAHNGVSRIAARLFGQHNQPAQTALLLVHPNIPVPSAQLDCYPSAINLAPDRIFPSRSRHRNWKLHADPPVARLRVDISPKVVRQPQVQIAVPGAEHPPKARRRSRAEIGIDVSISGAQVHRLEPAIDIQIAVAAAGMEKPFAILHSHFTIFRLQLEITMHAVDLDVPICRINIQFRFLRDPHFHPDTLITNAKAVAMNLVQL